MEPAATQKGGVGGGGGGVAAKVGRQMAAELAAFKSQIAAVKGRAASISGDYRSALLSARSVSEQTFSRKGELGGLKLELQNLEIHAVEALSNKVNRESECQLAKETISSTTAINEKLKSLVTDNRNKRDQRTTVISNHLEAVEALEAKCKEGETHRKSIEEAVTWYSKFLGFQVVGGEGVKFIFNKVDLENPDKEYSVTLKLDKDRYTLLRCYPSIKDCEELMKDLNLTNDLFKFVRTVRQRFQDEAANVIGILPMSSVPCLDTSSISFSSPVLTPLDSRIENVPDKSLSRSKNKTQGRPSKRRAAALSAASPGDVVSSVRRSPRFVGIR